MPLLPLFMLNFESPLWVLLSQHMFFPSFIFLRVNNNVFHQQLVLCLWQVFIGFYHKIFSYFSLWLKVFTKVLLFIIATKRISLPMMKIACFQPLMLLLQNWFILIMSIINAVQLQCWVQTHSPYFPMDLFTWRAAAAGQKH